MITVSLETNDWLTITGVLEVEAKRWQRYGPTKERSLEDAAYQAGEYERLSKITRAASGQHF